MRARRAPLVGAAVVLGVGLGGFVDGILLHQILQWHNMLSSRVPPTTLVAMKYNMVWDGLFHAFTWLATAAGVVLLWRAARTAGAAWSARLLAGGLALGWGLFNTIEGLIDHELLGLHHVHGDVDRVAWDVGFLVLGVVLIAIGAAAIAAPVERAAPLATAGPAST
jgi:uncharacterized membrane protein